MKTVEMVAEFSRLFDQAWHEELTVPEAKVGLLRLQLISEELGELTHALAASDPLETLDALVDIQYVIDGTYGAYGLAGMASTHGDLDHLTMQWAELDQHRQIDLLGDLHQALSRVSWVLGDVHSPAKSEEREQNLLNLGTKLNTLNSILQTAFHLLGFAEVKMEAFHEVHQSNLSKLGEDGKRILNEAGRVVKGPNYFKPDLARFVGGAA